MRTVAAGVVVAASLSGVAFAAQEINGNWYANLVNKISYMGLGTEGTYQNVVGMANGQCQQEPYSYSGPLSPLDEELSIHFRGPMTLSKVAVYHPNGGSSKKTKARRNTHERRHGHADFHKRNREIREIQERAEKEQRAVGDNVVVTMDGQVVSWKNNWDGTGVVNPAAATPAPAAPAAGGSGGDGAAGDLGGFIAAVASSAGAAASAAAGVAHKPHSSSHDSSDDDSASAGPGDWTRTGYYDAASGTTDGVTFLNNMGGQCSGVFDNTWGNSLSYSNHDGTAGACEATPLNSTLASNTEVSMFTDQDCGDSGSCGYARPGSVAKHGFGGAVKAFLFEFQMPHGDCKSDFNCDMPSLWLLNAKVPRTAQYASCSCWPACGEFDICEVLDAGNPKCKSTYHGNNAGGSSDYFARPFDAPMKLAVVMNNDKVHIQQLDDSHDFGSVLSSSTVSDISDDNSVADMISSVFHLAGGLGK